jgi:hypothetical protein
MTKSLTTIIANVQALLLDDGTRFSTATVTAACRTALRDFNMLAPIFAGTLVDVVSGQKEYALNDTDFTGLIEVINVLLQGTDTHLEDHTDLNFHGYFEDAQPFIRLEKAQTSGFLIVRFTFPYTVSGLDAGTESTIPAYFDETLIDGACYYSLLIRSAGRIETINLNQGVPDELQQALAYFRQAFVAGLTMAARRSPPLFDKDIQITETAWNDNWHGRS